MKAKVKPTGDKYWDYILVCYNDILVIWHEPHMVLQGLMKAYMLKEGSVAKPKTYMGANVAEHIFPDVVDPETIQLLLSSDMYIKRAIADLEQHLLDIGETLIKQRQPIHSDYCPELDSSPILNDKLTNYYQGLIGVLQWATELGQLDILTGVSLMSSIWLLHTRVILSSFFISLGISSLMTDLDWCLTIQHHTLTKADSQSVTGQSTIPEQRICSHQTWHSHEEHWS
jgi:hypothetical protein